MRILQAWNEIPAKMITASFLKCGITNNLDGTEDDLVYDTIEDTGELDNSFIAELFASDSESDFELLLFQDIEHLNTSKSFWTLASHSTVSRK